MSRASADRERIHHHQTATARDHTSVEVRELRDRHMRKLIDLADWHEFGVVLL